MHDCCLDDDVHVDAGVDGHQRPPYASSVIWSLHRPAHPLRLHQALKQPGLPHIHG